MTEYLDLADVLRIADRLFGSRPGIRDFGLIESALARPQATVFGEDAYPGLDGKAAALLASMARNHALVDGNKRLAWTMVRVFYGLNGRSLRAPHDDAYDLVVSISEGSVADITEIAAVLATWTD